MLTQYTVYKLKGGKKSFSLTKRLKSELQFHKFLTGKIIYIYGASTSGKSTLTKILSKSLVDYQVISTRAFKTLYIISVIKKHCLLEYQIVSQYINNESLILWLFEDQDLPVHLNARKNRFLFYGLNKIKAMLPNVNRDLKEEAALCLMYEYVFHQARKGNNIIVDNLDIYQFLKYKDLNNVHAETHYILLYCPPGELINRVLTRNAQAIEQDPMDLRYPIRPIETFFKIYQFSFNKKYIDIISRVGLERVIDLSYSESQKIGANEEELANFKRYLKQVEGIPLSHEAVYISSKFPYDVFYNTALESADKIVTNIMSKLKR